MSKSRDEYLAGLPSVGGWQPPVVYDVNLDGWRAVTQADVDKWQLLEQTYGRMVNFLRQEHAALVKACGGRESADG